LPLSIPYGPAPQQFGHLRVPHGRGPFPILVNIHGGFWRSRYDLVHADPLCAALTDEHAIATWNLEYRRPGHPGGAWPATLDDVRSGFATISVLAAIHALDRSRIVVMGHSAGGQLALYLAAHEPSIRGAIACAGVVDLEEAWRLGLSDDPEESAVAAFLGGTPHDVLERYAACDPSRLVIRVPQRLVHGANDDHVPVSMSRRYAERKRFQGEAVECIEIEGADHFDVIEPSTKAWATVAKICLSLLAP
jgi:acetyl esterase/lipase